MRGTTVKIRVPTYAACKTCDGLGVEQFFDPARVVTNAHLALASGIAFKCKYMEEPRICLGYMGEGATNIGGSANRLSMFENRTASCSQLSTGRSPDKRFASPSCS